MLFILSIHSTYSYLTQYQSMLRSTILYYTVYRLAQAMAYTVLNGKQYTILYSTVIFNCYIFTLATIRYKCNIYND